ncbi:hypothetical protein [Hephaestia mangrovi]|uniref:hypothetical protein n=1 Tax=Hephaestia mangrovi TaxID=2873268 RepID=UPI001CA64E2E|nr:hypothetical protein [Hephaestia mangrovi]MBY8828895.1 hypothetical protein [Hephaestia mangrovi]
MPSAKRAAKRARIIRCRTGIVGWLCRIFRFNRRQRANSALENILDRCGLDEVDLFMRPNAFRRIAS